MSHDISLEYISQTEDASGVKFFDAQVALSRKWVDGDMLTSQKTVQIKIPKETTEGLVQSDQAGEDIQQLSIPESEEQANETITRFEEGAKSVRRDENVADNVVQHMLQDRTTLAEEEWEGTEEEELNAYVIFTISSTLLRVTSIDTSRSYCISIPRSWLLMIDGLS